MEIRQILFKILFDPNWLTVFLLFATLSFTMFLTWIGRKKMRLSLYQRNDGNICIRAVNTSSNRNIQIDRYWYIDREGNKRIFDKATSLLNQQVIPGAMDLLTLSQPSILGPLKEENIIRIFVQDTGGKIYDRKIEGQNEGMGVV